MTKTQLLDAIEMYAMAYVDYVHDITNYDGNREESEIFKDRMNRWGIIKNEIDVLFNKINKGN
jgi:hypothetical protein